MKCPVWTEGKPHCDKRQRSTRSQNLPDVATADQHTRVVDGLRQTSAEQSGLQPTIQELLDCQTQHVIELLLVLGQNAHAGQTPQKGLTLEDTLGVLKHDARWKERLGMHGPQLVPRR